MVKIAGKAQKKPSSKKASSKKVPKKKASPKKASPKKSSSKSFRNMMHVSGAYEPLPPKPRKPKNGDKK